MIQRGIQNTGANYWAHLFPEAAMLYWYPVNALQRWLSTKPGAVHDGRSGDGTVTGRGHLVPKDVPFIIHTQVPPRMLAEFPWSRGSDSDRGQWGEEVVWWMLLVGKVRPPVWAVRRITDYRQQCELGDFELSFLSQPIFEIKTEGAEHAQSLNLFVQTEEGGHKIHLVRGVKSE